MDKRSLIEQLDEAVEAIVARRDTAIKADPKLTDLLDVAAGLRDLPREEFRARLKDDLRKRGSMTTKPKRTVKPIPEGFHTATPYLSVRDAVAALAFYEKAFGAREIMRLTHPSGKIAHAEFIIGNSPFMITDEFPEWGNRSPQSLGGSSVVIALYVEDVDAFVARAVGAGADQLHPVEDRFYGDRSARVADPFGHVWLVATHKEDVSPGEMQNRFDAMMKHEEEATAEKKDSTSEVSFMPAGFHTITPYLQVEGAANLIEFMKLVFEAEEVGRVPLPDGSIMHAEVRIGDSMVETADAGGEVKPTPAAIHLYVADVDAAYRRALEAGAGSIREPVDQFYGDREAAVRDPLGNNWYIATHKGMSFIPEGLRSVTPYLHPLGASKVIDFLKEAFGAQVIDRHQAPDGSIAHAKVRIGDSVIEMGEAHGEFQPMPASIHLYVSDADATYASAVRAGAGTMFEPRDEPYGDRVGGVTDPFGNAWYIATHKKNVST